jgi:hypothetical protein
MVFNFKLFIKNLGVKSLLFSALLSIFLFSACRKKAAPIEPAVISNPVVTPPVVTDANYVLTQEFRKGNNALILWKDDFPSDFTDGTEDILGQDMKIVGNDVYILANVTFSNGVRVIRVWKNGVSTDITTPSNYIKSSAMAISGNDVYVVGGYTSSNGSTENVAYWKNGVKTDLLNNVYYSGANCIKILGNDVYIGGYERDTIDPKIVICYWKNGVKMKRNNSQYISCTPTGIDVEGGNVYMSGTEKDRNPNFNKNEQPAYWLNNGITNFLLQSSTIEDEYAEDIKVSNGIIYVVGKIVINNKFNAVIWKSNSPTYTLLNNNSQASFAEKVQVIGTDVYVGGYEISLVPNSLIATIWKNGVAKTYLTTPNPNGGSAFVAMQFK